MWRLKNKYFGLLCSDYANVRIPPKWSILAKNENSNVAVASFFFYENKVVFGAQWLVLMYCIMFGGDES